MNKEGWEIEGKQGKGLHRPFFCGAPPNGRIKLYGTSMWCDIPAKADDQSGWDKLSPARKRNIEDLSPERGEIPPQRS
jgi:hypothetical protein